MSRLSPVESMPKSSPNHPLNPTLQAVLSSLDVNLEEELNRYRRQRPGKKVLYTNGSRRPQANKPLDLISVKATGGRTQAQAPDMASVADRNGTPGEAGYGQPNIPHGVVTPGAIPTSDSETVNPYYAQAVAAASQMPPDDYLESSEALLNLPEEEGESSLASARAERRSTDALLSPLGVGSMLLLLLASATLGYVFMNPASVSHLSFNRLFGSRTPEGAENATGTAANPNNTPRATGIPSSPNLASQEFDELSLRSLSTVRPRVSSTTASVPSRPQLPVNSPAPLPNATPPTVPLDLSRSLLPQPLQSGSVPLPLQAPTPVTTSIPVPGGTNKRGATGRQVVIAQPPSQQTTAKKSVQENRYLVVMPYSGDRSLAQARKVQPQAYLRRLPEGTRIQLAAFPDVSEARKKIQQLQKQGLSARLYRR